MTAIINNFIAEIRARPAFAAVSPADDIWLEHLAAIERFVVILAHDERPELIEISDRIRDVIGSRAPVKERLLAVGKLIAEARDVGRKVH